MSELELKAVVDDPDGLVRCLGAAGAARTFRGLMRDRRYDHPARDLLSRDQVLRVRTFEPAGAGEARAELTWKGPTKRTGGYKEREELQLDVGDAAVLADVLARLGYEVSDAIDRCVEFYEVGRAVVRLEWYPRMDVLVEVEGTPEEIERAAALTGIRRERFSADRLLEFAGRYQQRTGKAPVLALGGLGPSERPGWPLWAESSQER